MTTNAKTYDAQTVPTLAHTLKIIPKFCSIPASLPFSQRPRQPTRRLPSQLTNTMAPSKQYVHRSP